MPFTPGIYRSYDIRGVVPSELDTHDVEAIGRAFVVHTGAQNILVARDMRATGAELHAALMRGITLQSADVIDIGLATSPLFYYAVWQARADAGIMVTASHNPGKYNGFKMTRAEAVPISKDTGILVIRDLVEKGAFPATSRTGSISTADYAGGYLDYAAKGASDISPLTVVIDCGNGMVGLLIRRVLERMPQLRATVLYEELDGSFPHHEANPLEEENMRDLQERVRAEKADLGVAFDGDGDRVGFVDENSVTVPGDFITALIAQEILKGKPGAKVLYDLRSSWATKETIEAAGGTPIMSRVGHSYIKKQMRKEEAVFAGEMSSHFYFQEYCSAASGEAGREAEGLSAVADTSRSKTPGTPAGWTGWFYAESALRAMILLLRVLSERARPFSQLVFPLKKYAKTPEINFAVADKDALITDVKRRYADGKQFELDGLSVEYPGWWFNIRASGTEPLLRLNLEARTPELLEQKKAELFSLLGEPGSH